MNEETEHRVRPDHATAIKDVRPQRVKPPVTAEHIKRCIGILLRAGGSKTQASDDLVSRFTGRCENAGSDATLTVKCAA